MTNIHYPVNVKTTLGDFEMESLILECYAVRRPLAIPSVKYTIGEVVSHSSIMCVTARGNFLIEYTWDNSVFVRKVDNYLSGKDFDHDGFHYIHDSYEPQVPIRPVTIRRFANSMAKFMQGKPYDTFTHNCHQARYYTMKKYGMKSKNPKKAKRNIFFQGWFDFFGTNSSTKFKE
ncbi:hypothetical protein M9Y10_030671 [Tritrichomonas musculus]|uniref:LRAT domain-containing protein n=1 Tax=Tritrichomonas musculus TaxID=1915356 RepID=A0ABR2H3J2_9EUKA